MFTNFAVIFPSLLENHNVIINISKLALLDTNFGFNFIHFDWTEILHFWNLRPVWEYISNKQFYKPDQFLT